MTDAPIDPMKSARGLGATLPRRFYQRATAQERDGAFVILLDERPVRTPGRRLVAVQAQALAQAFAGEWAAQGEHVNPATMPLTRIVSAAIEGVADDMAGVSDEIVKYAGSDLVCYRALEPDVLVEAQALAWDSVLEWTQAVLDARFILCRGISFVAQPPTATAAVRRFLALQAGSDAAAPVRLAAISVMTALTGSALIALQCAAGALPAAKAWQAAHVDEDFQARFWGQDAEAQARRDARWLDMEAAERVLALTATGTG